MAQRLFVSQNPFTHEYLRSFTFMSTAQLDYTLDASYQAFLRHSKTSFKERGEKIKRLGSILRKDQVRLAELMTREMGKPIGQSKGEVLKCADCCDYYADNAERLLAPTHYDIPGSKVYVNYEPVGPLFIIMPFNFPLWMPLKCGIPHMMAGNTIILKHAENVPQCAEAIDRVMSDAGFEHEFKNTFLDMAQVSKVIADRRIRGVSLTGSIRAGRNIASMAGMALKKCVLELGGSDPFIVLGDADVEAAAKTAVMARLQGCGQVCISAKRFIVDASVHNAFVKNLIDELKTWQYGNPLNPEVKLGPLARPDLAENIASQVEKSVKMGAKLEYGGRIINPTQYEPAVLTNVTPDMPVMREETFGPVFAISKVNNTEEAISLANNTEYGLGAMIFTADSQKAENEIVPRIDAGMVFVNDVSKSIIQVPFGGMKNSGLGRELGEGIKEFTVLKTISIKK